MTDISEKKCVLCEGGISQLDYTEIHNYLKKVNVWDVKKNEKKSYYLEKSFKFRNFIESQKFLSLRNIILILVSDGDILA